MRVRAHVLPWNVACGGKAENRTCKFRFRVERAESGILSLGGFPLVDPKAEFTGTIFRFPPAGDIP